MSLDFAARIFFLFLIRFFLQYQQKGRIGKLQNIIEREASTYLMQLSGSPSQSVLHLNRSQLSHPIGGVLASPLSKHSTLFTNKFANSKNITALI